MSETPRQSAQARCAAARSLLFVPGNRSPLFEKAARAGPDVLILDLEDSVPDQDKDAARAAIEGAWAALKAFGIPVTVRINPLDTDAGEADVQWLQRLDCAAVVVPKAESPARLNEARRRLDNVGLIPLIESAAGLAAVPQLASCAGVLRLCIGHFDFMADTGIECDAEESEIFPLRFAVTMATRMHGLAPPVDGVTAKFDDDKQLRHDVRRAMRLGFGGKLCIHPRQVALVHDAFAPTVEELDWALRVVAADAASQGKATKLDGRMIDVPVVLRARRMIARAGRS